MMFVGKKTGPRKRGPKSLSDASARVYPTGHLDEQAPQRSFATFGYPTGHLDEQAPQRSFGTFGYPPVCESATSPPEPAALPWIR
jgi:hypothetical protein